MYKWFIGSLTSFRGELIKNMIFKIHLESILLFLHLRDTVLRKLPFYDNSAPPFIV